MSEDKKGGIMTIVVSDPNVPGIQMGEGCSLICKARTKT